MAVYHTYETFKRDIEQLRGLDRVGALDRTVTTLGTSPNGEWRIPVLKIGRNPDERVMIIGNDHAREWISGEVPFLIADALVKAANGAPLAPEIEPFRAQMQTLVNEREIWIAPVINPEGRAYSQRGREWWRKNRRRVPSKTIRTRAGDTWQLLFRIYGPEQLVAPPRALGASHTGLENIDDLIATNRTRVSVTSATAPLPVDKEIEIPTYGVDLNRNYPVKWGKAINPRTGESRDTPHSDDDGYAGTEAKSEWEVRAVIDTMTAAREEGYPFRAALSFHSRAGIVLYPWGYTREAIEEREIRELAEAMAHQINLVRNPSYNARQFADRVRSADLNQLLHPTTPQPPPRNEYFWAAAGVLDIGGEGGSFMDWVWDEFKVPSFTIEINPAPGPSGVFQEPESEIFPLFRENLAAALMLIERGGATLPGDLLSNTIYVCYLLPWCSRSDLAVAWMKNGRFLRRVHWGEDVECTLVVREPAKITGDLEAKFTVVESDVFRFSDDTLKTQTLPIPHQQITSGTRRFSIPWRVGDNQQRNDDAYADASPTVEYQFHVDVAGDVLRSAEIDLVQGAGVTWEVPDPFAGTFTLVGRFRGMPVQFDFTGTFIVLVTYEQESSGYDTVKTFTFNSRVDQQRISRQHHTIEVRQTVTAADLRAPDEEEEVRDYPFQVNNQIERVDVNLTREPRYAFEFKIVIGGQDFKRRVENVRVRMFEGTVVLEGRRPRLGHIPSEDDARERAYRARMVAVPPEAIEAVRREAERLNGGSDFSWWSTDPLQPSTERGILSRDRLEGKLRAFSALAASDPEVRAFLDILDVSTIATRFIGMPIQFWSTSDADRGVHIEITGTGRPANHETLVLGASPVRAVNDYTTITGIRVQSGRLNGVLFAGTTNADALPPVAVNATERAIRYTRLGELNEFLREGGSRLEVTSSDALDQVRRLFVVGLVDPGLRRQSFEAISIGATSRTQFFKVTDVFFDGSYNGVIAVRASRDGSRKTLWRGIYDEDIPELFMRSFRMLNQPAYVVTGQRTLYLQMLANSVREHLGIEKTIRVFVNATSGLRDTGLAASTSFDSDADCHLVAVQGIHHDWTDPSMVRVMAHELKHAFQHDRVAKLTGAAGSLRDLARSTDTFDLRVVKAWKLNGESGYISGASSRQDYPRQIREVDSDVFARAVFPGRL